MSDRYDALVIGGGPAGSTVAFFLARAGWSVAVVERKEFPRRKVCGEYLSSVNFPVLAEVGVADAFHMTAGPEIRRVGLFAGRSMIAAPLPRAEGSGTLWGRALGREHLDTLLFERAASAGAHILQPWSAVEVVSAEDGHACRLRSQRTRTETYLKAGIIVAAQGSWDGDPVVGCVRRLTADPASELLAFKAHFRDADLAPDLMPLLAFPGGYGGLVQSHENLVSLSCCIRRDMLASQRAARESTAGDIVLSHIMESCLGARRALTNAKQVGAWLAAGPIRPGIRATAHGRLFRVGNAAGEAHPVIAEGIGMALQGARLLAHHLQRWRKNGGVCRDLDRVAQVYTCAWRRNFGPRIYTAAAIAQWAMRPSLVRSSLPCIRFLPAILSCGARLSGKVKKVTL